MISRFALSFEDAIDKAITSTEDIEPLLICHTTFEGAFYDIQLNENIEPQLCSQFNESLSYFFYGKAAYVSKHPDVGRADGPKHSGLDVLTNDLPIPILFDLGDISNQIYRIFPFDSGGFESYPIRRGFKIEHFAMKNPSKEKLLKLVKSFFNTNENYLNRKLDINIPDEIIKKCRPLKMYIDMLSKANSNEINFGEQAFAIEIQYKDDTIAYKPKAIIIHNSYFTKEDWQEDIEIYSKHGIELYVYGNPCQGTMLLRKAYEEIEKTVSKIIHKEI